jgi:hypothetical protein
MDNFHGYLKKQLLEYVEKERAKGIPLEQIEQSLLNAGHGKNVIDEVFAELEKEQAGKKVATTGNVNKDFVSMLKEGFSQFMAQASSKEIKKAQTDLKKTDTKELVKEVIEDAEVIEEKLILESITFFIYIIIMGFIILLTTASTGAEIVKVIIGFSPAIINSFASFLAIKLADFAPLYMFVPVAIVSGFYALGRFAGIPLFYGMDIESLAVVNFLFSFVFNVMISYVRFVKPQSLKKMVLKKKPDTEQLPAEQKQESEEKPAEKPVAQVSMAKKPKHESSAIHELKKEFKI